MKNEKLLDSIGNIDDSLIEDALKKENKPQWIKWAVAAACVCVVAGAGIWKAGQNTTPNKTEINLSAQQNPTSVVTNVTEVTTNAETTAKTQADTVTADTTNTSSFENNNENTTASDGNTEQYYCKPIPKDNVTVIPAPTETTEPDNRYIDADILGSVIFCETVYMQSFSYENTEIEPDQYVGELWMFEGIYYCTDIKGSLYTVKEHQDLLYAVLGNKTILIFEATDIPADEYRKELEQMKDDIYTAY